MSRCTLSAVRIGPMLLIPLLLLSLGCRRERQQDPAPAASSVAPVPTPSLASRYQTPWGELGWERRVHDTITFTNEGKTFFLHCTVRSSPVVHCRWSKENPADPSGWDRGKAKLTYRPDHSLQGRWGHGDSDDDGGPCNLKPLPRT